MQALLSTDVTLGWWMVTTSGRGILGPCLPLGSQSFMMRTCRADRTPQPLSMGYALAAPAVLHVKQQSGDASTEGIRSAVLAKPARPTLPQARLA